MMRVAYVCADPGVPAFGSKGCSVHVQEVLREFVRRGFRVDLFAVSPGGAAPADLAAVRLHAIPLPRTMSAEERETTLLEANRAVTSLLAATGPYDLVYERHSLFAHAAMRVAADMGSAGILEVNAPLIDEQIRFRGLVRREEATHAARSAMAAAHRVVAVSQGVADYAIALRGSPRGVHVIPNGVNPERFAVPASGRRPHEPFTVGFLGTLKPWHGVELLVEAFARLRGRVRDARLLIVGDGPLRPSLEASCEKLCGDGAAEFTGAISPADVPKQLARMDCAAASYAMTDGCYFSPLKVLEYMAAGLPIVASRAGQISEMIEHGRTGLLVPPGDVPALATALAQVYAHREAAWGLGAAARQVACERFSWRRTVDRILALTAKTSPTASGASSASRRTA